MRVLLTGGAGFIGTEVAAACHAAGHEVRVIDALLPHAHPAGVRPELPDGVELIVGDLRDEAVTAAALRDVDVVCHQAAMVGRGRDIADAPRYADCSGVGTAVLLAAMARQNVRRLVLAGSVVVYGEGTYRCARHGTFAPGARNIDAGFDPPCPSCGAPGEHVPATEDDLPAPRNVYGATKLAQELLARAWAADTGGSATVLRYHHVYGPRMRLDSPYSGVACAFRSVVHHGQAIQVFEDGAMRRDFIHVADVARANVAGLDLAEPGVRVYNVATGEPRTIGDVAATIAELAGAPRPVTTGYSRFDDVRHVVASPRRIMRDLGWRPRVSFADGMRELVAAPMLV